MMKISLIFIESMLLNKSLGGVQIGDSRDKVIQYFGEPLDFLPQKKKNKAIFSYGALQLYLLDGTLRGFTFDSQKIAFFETVFLFEKIYLSDFLFFLDEKKINYESDDRIFFQTGKVIKVHKSFYFCFAEDVLMVFGFSQDAD